MAVRWMRRVWGAPIVLHCVALFAVLIALAAVVGTRSSFIEDEGAAVVQARHLADHGTWIVADPVPKADPDGRFYPYEFAEAGEHGVAPFGKHPVYALVLAGLWRVGGINAVAGLSLLGTVLAAAVASAFARRMDPAFARPTLWAVGIGSPLLFDSFLVIAHTVGAALAGALVLVLTSRAERVRPAAVIAVAALAAGLVLMRTEGVFLVAAAGGVVFLAGRARWLGVVAAAAGAVAFFAERLWIRRIVGAAVAPVASTAGGLVGGGVRGRMNGAVTTLLRPSYDAPPRADLLLLLALVSFTIAVLLARRASTLAGPVALLGAAAAVLRVVIAPPLTVPGLLVACPLLWVGGWAVATMKPPAPIDRRLVWIMGLFVVAVVATQYERGGGLEWGGRYFALALPFAIPLAVLGVRSLPRVVAVGVAVAVLSLSVMAIGSIRDTHRATSHLLAAINVHHDAIAITTAGFFPRLDWPNVEHRQWLLVPPDEVEAVLRRLPAAGVRHVIVVYPDSKPPRGWTDRGEDVAGLPWRIVPVAL